MKAFIIVEYKNDEAIWTDGKSYSSKEDANYSKDIYQKFYKKNSDLRILTLNLEAKKKSMPTNNESKVA